MPSPFGGHPNFAKYIQWARDKHGFRAQSGFATDGSGQAHTITRIWKEGGPSVIVSGIGQDEYLVASVVGFIDRRLNIVSPFFSVDDGE